jgi:hypothetical protein
MGYRWLQTQIDVNEDGTVDVTVEGRGPVLPYVDTIMLEPGDTASINTVIEIGDDMSDQPTYESYDGLTEHNVRGDKNEHDM